MLHAALRTLRRPGRPSRTRARLAALLRGLRSVLVAADPPVAARVARRAQLRPVAAYVPYDRPTYQRRGLHIPELDAGGCGAHRG